MPIPFLLAGAAVVAGVSGVAKGAKAVSRNAEAKELIERAQRKYDSAKEVFDQQRANTNGKLEKLGAIKLNTWSNEMNSFLKTFNSFKNVKLEGNVNLNERLKLKIQNPDNLKNMQIATLKATEVTKAGVSSLGAGALAGIASYGGAMMFASASTGTAIASLSGAAATNATLAWFGGGALSAGGLGMAGGTMVLGGIVAGPVLAVAGHIMAAKSEENYANAQKAYSEAMNAVEKMHTMTDFLDRVSGISDNYSSFINDYLKMFSPVVQELTRIKNTAFERQSGKRIGKYNFRKIKVDYNGLSEKEKKTLHLGWLMTQVLYSILAAPLLTKEGDIDQNVNEVLIDANSALPEIEQKQIELSQMSNDIPDIHYSVVDDYSDENDSAQGFAQKNKINNTTRSKKVASGDGTLSKIVTVLMNIVVVLGSLGIKAINGICSLVIKDEYKNVQVNNLLVNKEIIIGVILIVLILIIIF